MENWLLPREDKIEAKGKGLLQTYWLQQPNEAGPMKKVSSFANMSLADEAEYAKNQSQHMTLHHVVSEDKLDRLIQWNTDTLAGLLKGVWARRLARQELHGKSEASSGTLLVGRQGRQFPIDEVQEIIELPAFHQQLAKLQPDPDAVVLPKNVVPQLYMYVEKIASMYRQNSFHNFEHAR